MRTDDVKYELKIEMIAVNVPLILEPRTTAPVYFAGNFAAIPYTEF